MVRSAATTVKQYLASLDPDRRAMVQAVRDAINAHLEPGFEEGIQYGMIGWYVPHSIYPDGYHCDAKQPVPFASVASQKNNVSVYLFCMYIDPARVARFTKEWKATGKRLDMGKSCVRVKNMDGLAVDVIAGAVKGLTVEEFLAQYTSMIPGGKGASSRKPATKKKTAKKKAAKKKAAKKKATKKKATKKKATKKKATKKKATKKKTAKKKTAKKKTAKKKTAKKKTAKKKTAKKTTKKKATRKKR